MKFEPINNCDTRRWKADTRASVLFYNEWFMRFAPAAYINTRSSTISSVEEMFEKTAYMRTVTPDFIQKHPEMLSILRMATTPPLARDRLAGLSEVPRTFIQALEEGRVPRRQVSLLEKVVSVVNQLLDRDVMPWLDGNGNPEADALRVAKAIIGDRVCGATADPIIKNAQERRQLLSIEKFLSRKSYKFVKPGDVSDARSMSPGTYAYHLNVPVKVGSGAKANIPVDVAIQRKDANPGDMPLLVECKSAGDFANTNKRRKEEAVKMEQLKRTYGSDVDFLLFLCGYFDSGYLGYEAAEGIDWIWEHRITDLEKTGV